jgi:hypothetical protein
MGKDSGLVTILAFFIVYGIIGSVVGRILFRKRLGNSSRFYIGEVQDEMSWNSRKDLIDTRDLTAAQEYGLWSIPFWPLTLAIFSIQAPTPQEKENKRALELQEVMEKAQAMIDGVKV